MKGCVSEHDQKSGQTQSHKNNFFINLILKDFIIVTIEELSLNCRGHTYLSKKIFITQLLHAKMLKLRWGVSAVIFSKKI